MGIDLVQFNEVYLAVNGHERPCYYQPKRVANLMVPQLTGKPHDNILKDIRRILDEGEIGHVQFNGSYLSEQNKSLPCFNLPRLECDLVVSGYSAKYRLEIIDRWLVVPQPQITNKHHDNV